MLDHSVSLGIVGTGSDPFYSSSSRADMKLVPYPLGSPV